MAAPRINDTGQRKIKCIVCGNKELPLFRFPKQIEKCEIWLSYLFNHTGVKTEKDAAYLSKYWKICKHHFEDWCFSSSERRRLIFGAVPFKKTNFDNGELILTTHRLLWKDNSQREKELSLHLSLVVFLEKENRGWTRSGKIIIHLNQPPENLNILGPVKYSPFNFVKFSFQQGGESEFFQCLSEVVEKKEWEKVPLVGISGKKYRAGIVGIERQIQAKQEEVDKNISEAFKDLKKLMDMAKDMVNMSKTIAQKITEKKGCISEDETIQFKSHLLSLGISDPVTRDTHGTGDIYHSELAKQLVQILEKPLEDAGGILSLTDVYCRINRARGLELISPEDLVNACKMLETLNLPMKLHTFDSGVKVLKSASLDEHADAEKLKSLLSEHSSLSAAELSHIFNTTVILARERLLEAEKDGIVCRDDSIEGLRFYPNLFLTVED